MQQSRYTSISAAVALSVGVLGAAQSVQAYEFYNQGETKLNADMLAVYSWFNSRKSYDGNTGGTSWREGFIKYGVSFEQGLSGNGTTYGALNWVSSGTWGSGDAAGVTDGSERTTKIEDAFLGWRSGNLLPALGEDGLDISFGRQVVQVGDGFLINDDGLNFGNGVADGEFNRGGGYYLAARRAFDQTAVVRIGGKQGLHGDLMWLKSDNRAQAKTELAAGTLVYTAEPGELALTYIHGIGVDKQYASDFQRQRDGMDIYSVRGAGNAGVENANFAFEYARQDKSAGDETAWYVEAGYTFADVTWSPNLTYRYSRYSEGWDSLFNGFSRGYGTWFQGEVAANYAGPFNSNTRVHHVGLTVTPLENLSMGVLYFDFSTLNTRENPNMGGRELDLYAEWAVSDNLIITPLIGLYQPDKSLDNGGLQGGGNGTNVYSQFTVAVPF
ncbi:MAG: alginate export family protein [Ectopseudomonas guguanensis]|uniref:alginate export family protein n=1 Tax=Ectopseudomonas guguanensis TaxID=1198456 RepID=UPI00391C08D7